MVVKVSKPEINVREKLNELAPRTLTGDEYILNEHSHNGEYIKNGIAMYIDGKHPGCFTGVSTQPIHNLDGYFSDFTNTNVTKSTDGGGSFVLAGNATMGIGGVGNYNMYSSTCEAWFKATGTPTNGYHVIMQKNGGYSGAAAYGIRAGGSVPPNSNIAWFAHDAGASAIKTAGDFTPVTDQWYHLVSVVDADSGTLYAYLNGELVDTDTTLGAGGSYISDQGFNVGIGDGRYMNGRIALARVYNRPLSNGEIRYNYLQSLKRF
jgi:hypothetical protein